MGRLFIFGIGGTGSRVIRSLTMLLASGVEIKADEVVPIIIDPDLANGDTNRTLIQLKYYQSIREHLEFTKNTFFRTKISSLFDVSTNGEEESLVNHGFKFSLDGVDNQRFGQFINYEGLNPANKALVEVLFSQKNLESNMEVGFKGNPNIGSVVLNQFKDSEYFRAFASKFNQDDRIFIISSIFGGTGAAGFPLLLNNLRNADSGLSNHAFLRNAIIGAITVLPYFGVKPDSEKEIDKNTFFSKTKAALSYYARNITGNNKINALYYIGDKIVKDYENNEGADAQKNDAHFIELACALAIIDFMDMPKAALAVNNGRVLDPIYKEFGVKEDIRELAFNTLGDQSIKRIRKPFSQFFLFYLFLKHKLESSIDQQPWSTDGEIKIDSSFLSDNFYFALKPFFEGFFDWLTEMERNDISFKPFKLDTPPNNLFSFMNGFDNTPGFMDRFKINNFELFEDKLNHFEKKTSSISREDKFMALFSMATEELIKNKLKI